MLHLNIKSNEVVKTIPLLPVLETGESDIDFMSLEAVSKELDTINKEIEEIKEKLSWRILS